MNKRDQLKAQGGIQIGVVLQMPDMSVCAVTDLGRVTWDNNLAAPAAPLDFLGHFEQDNALLVARERIKVLEGELEALEQKLRGEARICCGNHADCTEPCTPRGRETMREQAIGAVYAEPELPGDMPDAMWEAIRNDRDAIATALRITVRQTKEGIIERIKEIK